MRVENRENVSEIKIKGRNDINPEIQFTGNWFIDAGILGFIQVMEDVYELPNDINDLIVYLNKFSDHEIKDLIYYAYLVYNIKKTSLKFLSRTQLKKGKKISLETNEKFTKSKIKIKKAINFKKEYPNEILSLQTDEMNKKILNYNELIKYEFRKNFDLFNKDNFLKKTFSNNKKTSIEKIDFIGLIFEEQFFQNLYFLNTSVNKKNNEMKVLDIFYDLIYNLNVKKEDKTIDRKIFDKTISKFMFSVEGFSNVFYGKPTNLEDLNRIIVNPHIFLLCFPFPFLNISKWEYRKNIFFYTPNLNVCYKINKKLKKKIDSIWSDTGLSIFKLTWSIIIDEISELNSYFTLENMYLIEYEGISQQALLNVEYVGIPKLQATIILDDSIRSSLNSNLQIKGDKTGENSEWVWVLEEFIKNRPLFIYIIKNVILRINKNTSQKAIKPILYSLSVDAKIKSLGKNTKGDIFSRYFSLELEDVVFQIKESYKLMNLASKNVSNLFSQNKKEKITHNLISAMKRQNKHVFVNIFLKSFLELSQKDPNLVKHLNNYIFNNIIQNEENWQNYALAMIVGLL